MSASPNEEIREKLVGFFKQRGYRVRNQGNANSADRASDLSFVKGQTVLVVKIAANSNLQTRNAILEVTLAAMDLTSRANLVYLAFPKLQASLLDASMLQDRGLGMLIYDSRSIEEAVAPRQFDSPSDKKQSSADIDWLRSRVEALEKTVENLSHELSATRARPIEPSQPRQPTPLQSTQDGKPGTALPSFLKGNPWVDILARRGREPDQVAA
ncbi:MAG: hypothetical protein V1857_01280 [archaeon]